MRTNRSAVRTVRRMAGVFALVAGIAAGQAWAAERAAPGATMRSDRAEVSYRDLTQLTELRQSPSARADWLDELSRYVVARAAKSVPAGQHLSVTITDVQLAGMFEPGRRPDADNVRIVRDTTPPRIDLSFRLETAQGAVLKEGDRKLRNLDFLNERLRHRSESLSYEKNLVDDWMNKEFASAQP